MDPLRYGIVNPLDQSLMLFNSLEQARESAASYLGDEDFDGETITSVPVFEIRPVCNVVPSEEVPA